MIQLSMASPYGKEFLKNVIYDEKIMAKFKDRTSYEEWAVQPAVHVMLQKRLEKQKLREKRVAETASNHRAYVRWAKRTLATYRKRDRRLKGKHPPRTPDARRNYKKAWMIINSEHKPWRPNDAAKRARKKNLVPPSERSRLAVRKFYKFVATAKVIHCRWCRDSVSFARRTVDHIVPLAKGGKHQRNNLCCACVSCNSSKGALMPEEFLAKEGKAAAGAR